VTRTPPDFASYRTLFESAAIGIAVTDGNRHFLDCNRTLAAMLGYEDPFELVGRSAAELTYPHDTPEARAEIERLGLRGGDVGREGIEKQYRRKDGTAVWIRQRLAPIEGTSNFFCFFEDISERKEVELELEKHALLLGQVESVGGVGAWVWYPNESRNVWSEQAARIFGFSAEEAASEDPELFFGVIHPDDHERISAATWESFDAAAPSEVEYRIVRRSDGAVRWVQEQGIVELGPDGAPERMFGAVTDVTERRRVELELRESEERFRLIAERSRDLIGLLDKEGRFLYISPSWESLLGHPAGTMLGGVAMNGIHPDDWPKGTKMGADVLRELRLRKADGSWLWVESRSYVVAGRTESNFAVIARDISERKRADVERQLLEDELRQALKMEAVGQLAGGIAHDFNNLLTVISGYTEILLSRLGSETDGSKEIAEISKAAERAAQLTRQLLAYSRKQILSPRALDLNNIVAETQAMLNRLIGEHIEFSTRLAEDLGSISADSGQIEQIIMNLVVNARDAMPEGGKLLLETGNISFADVSSDRRPDIAAGDYVMLAVTDSGQGIDAATIGQIFEPYYTTKPRGAGTGLGLSTVYGIVTQSGGHVEVKSEPGRGTIFRLYFPQVAEEAKAVVPKLPDERSLRGSETILLVEDEEAVRRVGREMLELYGYTVLLAADGAEGLELARSYPQPIQLLMTDILMPKMSGIELAEQLSALHPETKILYTSGYNDSDPGVETIEGAQYLQKPYSMDELAHTLRELLDPAATPER
jgi:two-component system, cell cycle sensor histidine kinase and response regulator CckA